MLEEPGLYAIVDPTACGERDPERVAEAILRGGCALLQLRMKHGPDAPRLALARRLAARCRAHGVPFVLNDRADLAALTPAWLHLGQDDLPIAEARRLVDAPIGRSTHDEAQARAAVAEGADLIAFGPVFDTRGKDAPDPTVGLDRLADVCAASPLPVVAIGGLTLERAPRVAATGARWGAAIGALCRADDPETAARALHLALGGHA
ncbi:MAG: thiamine phosphate synthase [Sandaracinaceae bacterium]